MVYYSVPGNNRKGRKPTSKMPTQVANDSNSSNNEIKVKTAYNGEVMITYINEKISYDELCTEIRGICRFPPEQVRHWRSSPELKFKQKLNKYLFEIFFTAISEIIRCSPWNGWMRRAIHAHYHHKRNWLKPFVCMKSIRIRSWWFTVSKV